MRYLIGLGMVGMLLSAVACGSSKDSGATAAGGASSSGQMGGGGSAGGAGPTADEACGDTAKAACEHYQSCSDGFLISLVFGDMATCVSVRTELCLTSLKAPDTGSTPSTKEGCAEETPKEACTDFIDLNNAGACVTPAGMLEDGAACGAAAQCKTTWCAIATGELCGKCGPLPKVGDACDTSLNCAPGQSCNTNTNKCQVPVKEGDACSDEAVCDVFLGCDDGGTGTGKGTCKALPAKVGAACNTTLGCDVLHGFLCYPPADKCGKIAFADPGQPCGVVSDTSYALCTHDAICNMPNGTSGTCVVPVGVGKKCDTSFGPSCTTGLTCVGQDGTGECQAFDPASCH